LQSFRRFMILIKIRRIVIFWLPTVFWMCLIFFLSSFHKLQASPIGWQDFIIRKIAHFSEYFILYLFFYRSVKNTTKFSSRKVFLLAFVLTIFYAISDEYHQTFVFGRTGRPFDIGVDSFGALLGLIFSQRLVTLLPEKTRETLSI
ncbi:MAG: VanZ family protein, partial [Microgenomates group bacterium]